MRKSPIDQSSVCQSRRSVKKIDRARKNPCVLKGISEWSISDKNYGEIMNKMGHTAKTIRSRQKGFDRSSEMSGWAPRNGVAEEEKRNSKEAATPWEKRDDRTAQAIYFLQGGRFFPIRPQILFVRNANTKLNQRTCIHGCDL